MDYKIKDYRIICAPCENMVVPPSFASMKAFRRHFKQHHAKKVKAIERQMLPSVITSQPVVESTPPSTASVSKTAAPPPSESLSHSLKESEPDIDTVSEDTDFVSKMFDLVLKGSLVDEFCDKVGVSKIGNKASKIKDISSKISNDNRFKKFIDSDYYVEDGLYSLLLLDDAQLDNVAKKMGLAASDRFSRIIGIIENKSKLGKPKNGKVQITAGIKEAIWERYIGDSRKGKCYCCTSNEIKCSSFEAGHVISEKDGGTVDVLNLRPICKQCNGRMGCQNMREYARLCYPDSPLLKET